MLRRSFLLRVVGASAAFGALTTTARAQSDSDPVDPAGRPAPRYTDGDTGSNADRRGRGRGPAYENSTGVTDSDNGPNADSGGRGRGQAGARTGFTDNDSGANYDSPGYGRGPRQPSNVTDSDPTDRPNYGRRSRRAPG